MAKIFGNWGKSAPAKPQPDPISSFAAAPLPRHAGPPASGTPLADHLAMGWPGVDAGYVVLPRSLAENMPLPWQQQLTSVLAQFHHTQRHLTWPLYRVIPSRAEKLVDLDEEQLAEAGYLVEIDAEGEMVYRERTGRKVAEPEETTVLVSCLDPIVSGTRPPAGRPPAGPPSQRGQAGPDSEPQTDRQAAPQRRAAPMNIGPQPVWPTPPGRQAVPPSPPVSPQQPPPPSGQPPARPEPGQPIDWFAEPATDDAGPSDESVEFGPTGDPIERPYRYDR